VTKKHNSDRYHKRDDKKDQKSINKTKQNNSPDDPDNSQAPGWISQKGSLWVITFASLFMFVLTAVQASPAIGWFEAILWGLGYGASIWLIFYLMLVFIRRVRKR
jgi:hypothetical protein